MKDYRYIILLIFIVLGTFAFLYMNTHYCPVKVDKSVFEIIEI